MASSLVFPVTSLKLLADVWPTQFGRDKCSL